MVNNFIYLFFIQMKVLKDDGKQFYLLFFTQMKVSKDDGKQFYLFIYFLHK